MPEGRMLRWSCLLLALLAASPAHGQQPAPAALPDTLEGELSQPAQPEPPRRILNIDVKNDRLSVELANVDFGTAIREVAGKAGFIVEGSGEVFSRKLDTKFSDIEIERGVTRLLSLVKEKNYMVHYAPGGTISKLEIFSVAGTTSPTLMQPSRPQFSSRPRPPARPVQPQEPATVVPRSMPSRPVPPPARPTARPPRVVQPQEAPDEDIDDEEGVKEIPYIPPQPKQPLFTPKKN